MRYLKLDEKLVMNNYAKVAVQTMTKEQVQQRQKVRIPTKSPSTARANHSTKKPSTSSGSKSIKRRKTRRTVADVEREQSAQKKTNEKKAQKKKTLNCTECSITIRILQRQRRRRRKQKKAILHQLKKNYWKLILQVKVQLSASKSPPYDRRKTLTAVNIFFSVFLSSKMI